MITPRRDAAFTLFEILAVLTIVAIGLTILVGSYGSWGTARALGGATRIVELGLQQARTRAISERAYVIFNYGTTNPPNNHLALTTGFQTFICTNVPLSVAEAPLLKESDLLPLIQQYTNHDFLPSFDTIYGNNLIVAPVTTFQRLPRQVRLTRRLTPQPHPTYSPALLIFRPDGSILTTDDYTTATSPWHWVALETVESFVIGLADSAPLLRLFRVDPGTGLVTVREVRP